MSISPEGGTIATTGHGTTVHDEWALYAMRWGVVAVGCWAVGVRVGTDSPTVTGRIFGVIMEVSHWVPFVRWSCDHDPQDTRDSERPPTYSAEGLSFRAADPGRCDREGLVR